jgi:hypothetical protein
MRLLTAVCLSLLSLAAAGCRHPKCHDPQPRPRCYAGTVVAETCLDGVLIEVDSLYPIGRPVGPGQPGGVPGRNMIAAVNPLGNLNHPGQRVYFTYRNDPSQQSPGSGCRQNALPLAVPHLVLSNLSATACAGSPQ